MPTKGLWQEVICTIPMLCKIHKSSPSLLWCSYGGLSFVEEVLQQPPLQGDWRPLRGTPKALFLLFPWLRRGSLARMLGFSYIEYMISIQSLSSKDLRIKLSQRIKKIPLLSSEGWWRSPNMFCDCRSERVLAIS